MLRFLFRILLATETPPETRCRLWAGWDERPSWFDDFQVHFRTWHRLHCGKIVSCVKIGDLIISEKFPVCISNILGFVQWWRWFSRLQRTATVSTGPDALTEALLWCGWIWENIAGFEMRWSRWWWLSWHAAMKILIDVWVQVRLDWSVWVLMDDESVQIEWSHFSSSAGWTCWLCPWDAVTILDPFTHIITPSLHFLHVNVHLWRSSTGVFVEFLKWIQLLSWTEQFIFRWFQLIVIGCRLWS